MWWWLVVEIRRQGETKRERERESQICMYIFPLHTAAQPAYPFQILALPWPSQWPCSVHHLVVFPSVALYISH